jgi:ABC-type oligopeptide transport system substrate-binding subunit
LLFNYFRNHSAESQHNQKLQALLDTAKTTMLASTIPEMLASKKIMISLFEQELPLIPLWQLDRYWAWKKGLQLNITDSLHLFQNASSWKKEPNN